MEKLQLFLGKAAAFPLEKLALFWKIKAGF
jgi:hypothetical protein